MAVPDHIPILRASIFEPFLVAAREIGIPVAKHLRKNRLPNAALDNPDMLLPEVPCWRFLDSVARTEGIDTYGLVSGKAIRHPELSSLAPLLADSVNLKELLTRFCAVAPMVSNSVSYRFQSNGRTVWFSNGGRRLLETDVHAQLFQVLGMMQLVQLVAGPAWRPTTIHFSFAPDPAVANAPDLQPSRVHFCKALPAISFPSHLLALPMPVQQSEIRPVQKVPESFGQQLHRLLLPYLDGSVIDKSMTAEIVGMSKRTLQRRLATEGMSFRHIIDRTKHVRASEMLAESDAKLIDIAMTLGYQDAPSFTRAFKRWSGISPSLYRRRLRSGAGAAL